LEKSGTLSIGNHYCIEGNKCQGWMNYAPDRKTGYTEITFDQFKKYVLKTEVKEETLLEKAKRLYPVGTKFKAARGINGEYKVQSNSKFRENSDGAICIQTQGNGTIYYNGIWAEIIE
jgi:hypothetical protein